MKYVHLRLYFFAINLNMRHNFFYRSSMFIIFTNLVVSISAGVLCLGIGKYFLADKEWEKAIFVFFSTLSVYNFQRVLKISNDTTQSEQMMWMLQHKISIYTLTLIGSIGSIYYFVRYFFHPYYFLLFIPAGVVCFLYALKFLKMRTHIVSLRELPFVKIFLIALIWAVSCFWFPIIAHPNFSILETILLALIGFIYVLAVTIPFDIRDLKYDCSTQKTIPQIIGWKAARTLSIFLLIISFGGLILLSVKLIYAYYFWLAFGLHLFLLLKANPNRPSYYFSGFIDGIITTLGLALYFS